MKNFIITMLEQEQWERRYSVKAKNEKEARRMFAKYGTSTRKNGERYELVSEECYNFEDTFKQIDVSNSVRL